MGAWLIEAGFVGLGGGETQYKPDDFLPFKLKAEGRGQRAEGDKLSVETITIFRELVENGELPTDIVREFWLVDGLQERVMGD